MGRNRNKSVLGFCWSDVILWHLVADVQCDRKRCLTRISCDLISTKLLFKIVFFFLWIIVHCSAFAVFPIYCLDFSGPLWSNSHHQTWTKKYLHHTWYILLMFQSYLFASKGDWNISKYMSEGSLYSLTTVSRKTVGNTALIDYQISLFFILFWLLNKISVLYGLYAMLLFVVFFFFSPGSLLLFIIYYTHIIWSNN